MKPVTRLAALWIALALIIASFGVLARTAAAQSAAATEAADDCLFIGADTPDNEDADAADDGEAADSADHADDDADGDEDDADEADDADEGAEHEADEASDDDDADEADETDDGDESADDADDSTLEPTGTIQVNEALFDGMTDAEECAAMIALATVTPDEAQAAAEAETGSTVIRLELDVDDGYLVYNAEMADGTEVTIDAGSADVLEVEPLDDADD